MGTEPQGWGFEPGLMPAAGKTRSMISIVNIHFVLGSYGTHWSECEIPLPHRESSLVSLKTISSSNRY